MVRNLQFKIRIGFENSAMFDILEGPLIKRILIMSKGLSLTRTTYPTSNELFFLVEDSNGQTIPIKQTFLRLENGQIKMNVQAGNQVKIYRGELIKAT